MSMLDFHIDEWLGMWDGQVEGEAALAAVRIEADGVCFTEVNDQTSRTVRRYIRVSAYALARWLLINWWRLRWEPFRPGREWLFAHSLAAIGEGYVWPPATIASDGEFIQVQANAGSAPDMAAIRYLTDAMVETPAAAFEQAVDALVERVQTRLASCRGEDRDLRELQEELADERSDPEKARACRLQATAGIDPGDMPTGWLREMNELDREVGSSAIGELAAVLPSLHEGTRTAREGVDRLRQHGHQVDLGWLRPVKPAKQMELPWQKGARMAAMVRQQLGVSSGPLSDQVLWDCLGTNVPMGSSERWAIQGGVRCNDGGKAKVAVPSPRAESQRFHLARVMAASLLSPAEDRLLAVTSAGTAMQKCERSFAQELLCPWIDLDAYTSENGLDDDSLADAADYFQVSEWVVRSTLVNKGKLSREHLPSALR